MATVKNLTEIDGRIKNVSFYTMEGSDKIILRSKGGASKYRIKNHPNFAKVRLNNQEWKGCTTLSKNIFNTLSSLFVLADYPVIGTLNGLCKMIQTKDTEGEHGARGIYLSQHKEMLAGFSPNKKRIFEQIISIALNYSIKREAMSAELTIPAINTSYQLVNDRNLSHIQFIVSLGLISDVCIQENETSYVTSNQLLTGTCVVQQSPWFSTAEEIDAQQFELALGDAFIKQLTDNQSLVLGIGLQFGKENVSHQIEAVKHSGSARLLQVV
jgi:hypothetical protein